MGPSEGLLPKGEEKKLGGRAKLGILDGGGRNGLKATPDGP